MLPENRHRGENDMNLLAEFEVYLRNEEKSQLTIEKYLRDVRKFLIWLGEKSISKREVLNYKEMLAETYEVASVNSMLSSLNCYLGFIDRPDCRVKTIRRQRRTFCLRRKNCPEKSTTGWYVPRRTSHGCVC